VLTILFANPSQAELLPEAQAAVKKGIIAAKEQEWQIAIQSFQDARKLAPDAPEVYYNLGLAESRIPGRELRAIAWFGAYLAATSNTSNATAVDDFISGLQIKNEGNLSRLIKSVQDAAGQTGQNKANDLITVGGLWAEAGDMTAAGKIVESHAGFVLERICLGSHSRSASERGRPCGGQANFGFRPEIRRFGAEPR